MVHLLDHIEVTILPRLAARSSEYTGVEPHEPFSPSYNLRGQLNLLRLLSNFQVLGVMQVVVKETNGY